jgi:hypothetical protein
MLFSQMACKQVAANVVEYLKPLWTVKPKLAALDNEFADCLRSFEEDCTGEKDTSKEGHELYLINASDIDATHIDGRPGTPEQPEASEQ